MSSVSKSPLRAVFAGCVIAVGLAAAGAAQAQAVVLRSTGPSATTYPQGKKLPANAKVTLRAGDRVTVLDKAGTRVLAGPGSYTLDGSVSRNQTTTVSRVSSVLSGGGATRTRTGAVRGVPPMAGSAMTASSGPDSVWYVDVTKGGRYCVANPNSLILWRPNRDQQASGKLASLSGGKSVAIAWKRGNPLKSWPTAELPVTDGASYTFSDPVGPTVTITTVLIGAMTGDELAVASLLADKGCKAQLDVIANAAGAAAAGG